MTARQLKCSAAIVLAVVLAACGVDPFRSTSEAKRTAATAQEESFARSLKVLRKEVGRFPSESEGLDALFIKPDGMEGWRGPYLSARPPDDPWGRPYLYHVVSADHVILKCLGSDGAPGGTGPASDIVLDVGL